jgi:hypothetical protein
MLCFFLNTCFIHYFLYFYSNKKALMAYRLGDFQESFGLAAKALKLYSNHVDSKELIALLQNK